MGCRIQNKSNCSERFIMRFKTTQML